MAVFGRSNRARIRIDGDPELRALLRRLPRRIATRIVSRALMAGASPILEAARTGAPKETGLLRRSIRAKRTRSRATGHPMIVIAPASVKRAFRRTRRGRLRGIAAARVSEFEAGGGEVIYRNPANYAPLVEYGHGGPHPARAHPFMRPAFDAKKAVAQARIRQKMREGVHGEARKLAAKTRLKAG